MPISEIRRSVNFWPQVAEVGHVDVQERIESRFLTTDVQLTIGHSRLNVFHIDGGSNHGLVPYVEHLVAKPGTQDGSEADVGMTRPESTQIFFNAVDVLDLQQHPAGVLRGTLGGSKNLRRARDEQGARVMRPLL